MTTAKRFANKGRISNQIELSFLRNLSSYRIKVLIISFQMRTNRSQIASCMESIIYRSKNISYHEMNHECFRRADEATWRGKHVKVYACRCTCNYLVQVCRMKCQIVNAVSRVYFFLRRRNIRRFQRINFFLKEIFFQVVKLLHE